MQSCLVTQADQAAGKTQERRQSATERAWNGCFDSLKAALSTDARKLVATPGFYDVVKRQGVRSMPAHQVLEDMFSGATGDAVLLGLLEIMRDATAANGELGDKARAWLDAVCGKHADFHAEDAREAA